MDRSLGNNPSLCIPEVMNRRELLTEKSKQTADREGDKPYQYGFRWDVSGQFTQYETSLYKSDFLAKNVSCRR